MKPIVSGQSQRHEQPAAAKISAVIKVRNESGQIEACIQSLDGFATEIIVVDDESTDDTAAVAAQLGARVIPAKRGDRCMDTLDVMGFHAASGDWFLRLDADERMVPTLARKLKEIAHSGNCDAVRYARKNIVFGAWARHGGWFRGYLTFFRKSSWDGVSPPRPHTAIGVSGRTLFLPEKEEYATLHFEYGEVQEYALRNLWKYALTDAKERYLVGQRFSRCALLWRPVRCFLGRCILRQGFRDGNRGLILAGLLAAYEFCIQANLWDIGRRREAFDSLGVRHGGDGAHLRRGQMPTAACREDSARNSFPDSVRG